MLFVASGFVAGGRWRIQETVLSISVGCQPSSYCYVVLPCPNHATLLLVSKHHSSNKLRNRPNTSGCQLLASLEAKMLKCGIVMPCGITSCSWPCERWQSLAPLDTTFKPSAQTACCDRPRASACLCLCLSVCLCVCECSGSSACSSGWWWWWLDRVTGVRHNDSFTQIVRTPHTRPPSCFKTLRSLHPVLSPAAPQPQQEPSITVLHPSAGSVGTHWFYLLSVCCAV